MGAYRPTELRLHFQLMRTETNMGRHPILLRDNSCYSHNCKLLISMMLGVLQYLFTCASPRVLTTKLCATCEKHGLSPDKFVVPVSHGPVDRQPGRLFHLNTGQDPEQRTVRSLKKNAGSGCLFCKLLLESLTNVNDETVCWIEWVLDGQQAESTSADRYASISRRIRVSWLLQGNGHENSNRNREELYFFYVPPQIPERPKQDIKTLITNWINQCEHEHEECKHIEEQDKVAFKDLVGKTSVGFIDVDEMKLAQLQFNKDGRPVPYIALSYVWGPKRKIDHRTLHSNVMNRTEPNGLKEKDLPLTIRDAIKLVRLLGYRYIWIDSLCIVQDSPRALRDAVKKMNLIFGNAHFTICAADGDNPSDGLKALTNTYVPREEKIKADLQLLVSKPSESIIQASTWNKRAWTFQERILSRRCLVFVGDEKLGNRIYFQCRSTNLSQDIYPIGTGSGWHSDWRKSPLRTLNELKKRPIRFYMSCVRLYTGRNLSEPKDILDAFDGVSRLMETYMRAPFFFGLPSSHFDFALLWRPKCGKGRRGAKEKSIKARDTDGRQGKDWGPQHDEDWEFPSWSWSGWEAIKDPRMGAAVDYPLDVLEGCLLDLHEWLLKRTWIVWYIRDMNGDLQPLWKDAAKYSSRIHVQEEERWRGYDYCLVEEDSAKDNYGRQIRESVRGKKRLEFDCKLPENPYGVITKPPDTEEYSYRPILQFWTWKCVFHVQRSDGAQANLGDRLVRLQVADTLGHTCGTVVVDEQWLIKNGQAGTFIALSEAKKFTEDECSNWSYYIPKDLEDIEWDLFYVMLIQENQDRGVWERVGLGKVLKVAFETEGRWAEIQLG